MWAHTGRRPSLSQEEGAREAPRCAGTLTPDWQPPEPAGRNFCYVCYCSPKWLRQHSMEEPSQQHFAASPHVPATRPEHAAVSYRSQISKQGVHSTRVPLSALFPFIQKTHIHTWNYSTNINTSMKIFLNFRGRSQSLLSLPITLLQTRISSYYII